MTIHEILQLAIEKNVSDIFIIAGSPISFKINGNVTQMDKTMIHPDVAREIINEIYTLNKNRSLDRVNEMGDDDFSFSISGLGRFRASVYYQRGSLSAVLRVVKPDLPNPVELSIPNTVTQFSKLLKGLVLVTGSAGCGKSTTLACIIDEINKTRNAHIVTIEDPIEYLHKHKQSIVSQREIGNDANNYAQALRATLRQAPDVILVGEMRDYETIKIALSAAETGHLVLSTLHTLGAAETINRIIDVFPPEQQRQIQIQLSTVLQAIVSQQLLPTVNNELIPAFEILLSSNAIRTQIRDGKTYQIDNYISTGKQDGMMSMDDSIFELFKEGKISKETAVTYAVNQEIMEKKIGKV
ncbi:type IV pilus twitching motility protein PilT [Anaerorhabdus sp.]|uniref:type IV pilus twitching motility protein PilT n=1 Tax=Anaerorhabdus sp. TaxID=1872524 RepID=UPI002FCB15AB